MSKSLGNVLLVHDLVQTWPGEVIRWALLSGHYRAPLNWTDELLEQAKASLDRLYGVIQDAERMVLPRFDAMNVDDLIAAIGFEEAVGDDLNTPKAIAELHALDKPGRQNELGETLKALGFSGKLTSPKAETTVDEAAVNALIQARLDARKAKNWAESDRIRDELASVGIAIKDNKDGTTSWEVKR